MGDIFLSIRGRVTINVEALNMTESVGNYVKHRRVPAIVRENGGYAVYFVPSISGESIAHGFQEVLAETAINSNPKIPVCKLCEKGIFLKSSNEAVFKESFNMDVPADDHELEKVVLEKCIVEDVGGFLFAYGERNVKRTSNFYVGYMIPASEAIRNVVIEPQLQTRYALGTPFVKGRREERGQMIYYVELSSAPYTFSFDLDTKYIGKTAFVIGKKSEVGDRVRRIEATLDALQKFLLELMFGAKKSRFLPVVDWESIVLAVSDDVWTVPSSFTSNYIEKAFKKKEKISYNTSLHVYDGTKGSFEEAVINAIAEAKKRIAAK
ncbi:MAG: type I-A CRISPR-associated protein Cas7/Csa2 [archaeon YNP-LCB-003-016]|uniref:type I-A CRISPR-associated protein Cas7/Csa2 n=1 Tax=Candidatus Culexarchaeum yellowstonense TaxID=2928963 RepID=UPI0026EDC9DD|nr:type I-A CRISPR-associated protein Cas7/Csa2 [Candidatus Culexarchaeum yellowstonense]MCC6019244.1 type I-A CRISPR-associated protein Cas7/Csa2 [Candidatus Verstraetearchaeota archaeon]MCR6692320.1 type I-A CRISPR-associated protein Cas7/Csa2 [Candidatus Culexarchaeum yellowstonense]